MKNRAKIHKFFKKVEEIFIFYATVWKFSGLYAGWNLATNTKIQHNTSISKIMPAKQKKNTGTSGLNINIDSTQILKTWQILRQILNFLLMKK